MDSLRGDFAGHETPAATASATSLDEDAPDASADVGADDACDGLPPPVLAPDERRMQVRAYSFWTGLLSGDRAVPSLATLDPATSGFAARSVLLDCRSGAADPRIVFLGNELADVSGLAALPGHLAQAPIASLLAEACADHARVLATQAPRKVEAAFTDWRGMTVLCRGVLLPFAAEGEAADHVYGVVNWKEVADPSLEGAILRQIDHMLASALPPREAEALAAWADGPLDDGSDIALPALAGDAAHGAGGLAAALAQARAGADAARRHEQRAAEALTLALGDVHDMLLAAQDAHGLAALEAAAGGLAMAGCAETALVRHVFATAPGDAREVRLAAILAGARRNGVPAGALPAHLRAHAGGIEGLVGPRVLG